MEYTLDFQISSNQTKLMIQKVVKLSQFYENFVPSRIYDRNKMQVYYDCEMPMATQKRHILVCT